jgi:hypothetical protein
MLPSAIVLATSFGQRTHTSHLAETLATPQIVTELNQFVIPKIPYFEGLDGLVFGLSAEDRVQIIYGNYNRTKKVYEEQTDSLIDIAVGSLALSATLYLMANKYQVKYLHTGTPNGQNIKLCLTLQLFKDESLGVAQS